MTGARWWSALDDAALLALGSAGLLRRARAARIGRADPDLAEVEVDGFRVALGQKGPALARCPCPATGLCLHVLAAVMALRDASPAAPVDVADEVGRLTDADIAAFAGADMAGAVRLAHAAPLPEPGPAGASVTLHPPGLTHPVTFLSGAGLRGAVWKGPDGRRRIAVATAALILRATRGLPVPAPAADAADMAPDPALMADIAQAIEAAVPAVLAGFGAMDADRLLDLALSARIDAAPRMAGALRMLVQLAQDIDRRAPDADAAGFLIAAARVHALAHALGRPGAPPGLAGRIRRDYRPAAPLAMVMLGARLWQGGSGARGLRLWGHDPAAGRWIATGVARPAGVDPGFDPAAAWHGPLLGQAASAGLVGQTLTFQTPRLSEDGVLAADSPAQAGPGDGGTLPEDRVWQALTARLRSDLGPPLTRDTRLTAALLHPAVIGDPLVTAEGWCLPVRDAPGDTLFILAEGLHLSVVHGLARLSPGCRLLVEAREQAGRLRLVLVSVISAGPGLRVWCPSLERVPDWLLPPAPRAPPQAEPAPPPADPLARDLLLAALDLCHGQAPDPHLADRAVSAGLGLVAPLLEPPASAGRAMRLAWIAAELSWKAAR